MSTPEDEAHFDAYMRLGGVVSDVSFDLDGRGALCVVALPWGVPIGTVLQRRSETLTATEAVRGQDGKAIVWRFIGSGTWFARVESRWFTMLDHVREFVQQNALTRMAPWGG